MSTMAHECFSREGLYRSADRLMVGIVWLLFGCSLALAGWYGTWTEALWIGLPTALLPTALLFLACGSVLSRLVNAAAFMVFSALHIHQGHGMIELHFGIFVLLAALLAYRDWKPLVAAAAIIAVHQLGFDLMQQSGYAVHVFENRTGFQIVLIHAAYVVLETAVLVYLALRLNREAVQTEELSEIGQHLAVMDGKVDLTFRKPNAEGTFARSFNEYMEAVHGAIEKTKLVGSHVTAAVSAGVDAARSANEGAARQREETDQLASAMNEMAASVQEVARNAGEAAEAARRADAQSREGRSVAVSAAEAMQTLASRMQETNQVISELEANSERIGTVLDVIRGIAEQTNLLALNAAIEAARAGEQGRGFAVVADEVRTLASRTQESTQEIQSMIEELQERSANAARAMGEGSEQVSSVVTQVSDSGDALQRIAEAVAVINSMNDQIASAAEQQSAVAEEINRNVVSISDLARDAAEHAGGTLRTSESLHELSQELTEQVERFEV